MRRSGLWLLVWLVLVACVNLVPRQGWDPAAGPVVPHDSFPGECSLCHTGEDWRTLRADFRFDHGKETGLPLEGAHERASCLLCHNDRGPVQMFAARGCAGCHADPHLARLGANCADCHNERTWFPREAIAMHDQTRFPLVGAHAAVACFRCHGGASVGNFAGAPSACFECHQEDYRRGADPDHLQNGFSRQCQECHLPTAWTPARFDHPASFPLTSGHAGRSCRECHTTPNTFAGESTDCASCHQGDWAATAEPNHASAGFGVNCDDCHDARAWGRARWSHPANFELTFGHAGRRCSECHVGQVYAGSQGDCSSCHLATYQATQNPNHALSGFGTDCESCHSTARWNGASVEHPESFRLENSHQRACTACHTPGNYGGLDPTCSACHLPEFTAATNPNHIASGFGTDCQTCHGTRAWQGATVAHPPTFPLTGSHNVTCTACHAIGNYGGLSAECASCHLPDYQATASPPHGAFLLSQQCEQCHVTQAWQPASGWQHQFPITQGDHAGLTCFDCHTNPANRPAFSCIACHEHNQVDMADEHDEVAGYAWTSAACYQCHPTGQK